MPKRTVKELFALSNAELMEAWQEAKIEEIGARFGERTSGDREAYERLRLDVETIRLVISFRFMSQHLEETGQ